MGQDGAGGAGEGSSLIQPLSGWRRANTPAAVSVVPEPSPSHVSSSSRPPLHITPITDVGAPQHISCMDGCLHLIEYKEENKDAAVSIS